VTVGLIGYGRFGRLAARFLARRVEVLVYDIRGIAKEGRSGKISTAPLAEVASQRVVILAVPISALRGCLRKIAGSIRPGALVIDVCSVKAAPAQWMHRLLPRNVHHLGTHPLFGPDSVSRSLRNRVIVLCPGRISGTLLLKVIRMLRREGLEVLLMSPKDHDRMVAETLLLTQYIGRLVHSLGLRHWKRSTVHYEKLLELCHVAERDSVELFRDMWNFNPYARNLDVLLAKGRRILAGELHRSGPSRKA
jgi:prephenate dehydrogenase